jgi:hypothetical protein
MLHYLHVCTNCTESFDDDQNTPKEEALCPHCTMLPELNDGHYFVDAPTGISPGGTRHIITPAKEGEERSIETIDTGFTGLHVKGTANLAASKPQRHHIFKKKPCVKCKKMYQPDAGNSKWCETCKPLTVIKTRQAKKYLEKLENPRKGRGPDKPSKVTLEKLASGLISEVTNKPAIRSDPNFVYTTGLQVFEKQDSLGPLSGYWIRTESPGFTHDRRQIIVSKEIISGKIAIDLWNPRERFISDSTSSVL